MVLRVLINLIRVLIFTFYWVCLFCRKTFRHFIWQYMWSYRFLLLSQLVFDCFYTERCIMKIKQCKEDRIYLCTIHKGYTFLGYLRSTLRPLTWFSLFLRRKTTYTLQNIYPVTKIFVGQLNRITRTVNGKRCCKCILILSYF